MEKTLVLAEKPSVGKDVAKVLGCHIRNNSFMEGNKYVVTWAMGHLVTLADPETYEKKYEKWDLNDLPIIPEKLKLVVIPKTGRQFNAIKALLNRKDISQIVIATDAGREGELVARWILEKAGVRKKTKRLWISSVTDKAIREGFRNLKDAQLYENLYKSALARAEADWIVGINATRALTSKYNAQLSCGRVQTPTLSMILKREEEIRAFVPKSYCGIMVEARNVTFHWRVDNSFHTFNEEKCNNILKDLQGKSGEVISVVKSDKKTYPPLLYDLTQLQADANKIFNFSAKETLSIMQSLYETHKILTYPRTDSKYLTQDIIDTLAERVRAVNIPAYKKICVSILKGKFSKNAYYINDDKVSDHHAIIPTEQPVFLQKLSDKERKIYDLVVKRFLSALLPPFEYEQTEITLQIGSEIFIANGKKVKLMGFKELFADNNGEEALQNLPDIKIWEKLKIDKTTKTTGKTKPPSPFNEATLLLAMENPVSFMDTDNKELIKTIGETGGVGTVATRADIIEKLFNSFVMEKRGKEIFITPKGKQLLQLAPPELTSPLLTAQWETRLLKISKGQDNIAAFKNEIIGYTHEIIKRIKASESTFKHDNITLERCPACGKFLLSVTGKKGKMLICQNRECGYKKSVSLLTNSRCPICHKKLELAGEGEKKVFVCSCGHKEKYSSFLERRKKESDKMSKGELQKYLKHQQDGLVNNPMKDAFKNIQFDK